MAPPAPIALSRERLSIAWSRGTAMEHGIRRFGQIINRFETGKTTDRLALRVDWPEWTVIADALALASHSLGINAAQNGNMARARSRLRKFACRAGL